MIFDSMFQSSWRSLIIGLAGMLSSDQESITLGYLLDLATNHPYDFKHSTPDQVKRQVVSARIHLEGFNDLDMGLRALRDRRLAHLDRKLINEPGWMQDNDLTLDDCYHLLSTIEDIVGAFHAAFHGERKNFEATRTMYSETLIRLIA